MPHRLSPIGAALAVADQVAYPPARGESNDNEAWEAGAPGAEGAEPRWTGPGRLLSLGVQDGRHGLGRVRVGVRPVAEPTTPPGAVADPAILIRLLAYYGAWMGFEGRPEPVPSPEAWRRPVPASTAALVEYRLDLRRIARNAQALTADGLVLLDGRVAAELEGLSLVFLRGGAAPRPARLSRRGA